MSYYTIEIFDLENKTSKQEIVHLTASKLYAEEVVRRFYEEKGFDVISLITRGQKPDVIPKEISEQLDFSSGVPDFLIVRKDNKKEYFFCEVKSINDSIRYNQFDWAFNPIIKHCFIFVTNEESEQDYENRINPKLIYTTTSYNNKPMLVMKRNVEDTFPLQIGKNQAKLILNNFEAIRKFSETLGGVD